MVQNIKSYLSTGTGTEGSLLIVKKIFDTIIEEADKALIPRDLAAVVIGPEGIPGSSIDMDLLTPNSLDVRQTAEGAEIINDNQEYTSFNVKPLKYGVLLQITREMLEDGKWNLLQHGIQVAGRRMAENENSLIISDALDNAGNTVSGGAALTIPNITVGLQNLEDNDYQGTDMIIGNEAVQDLRNIDTFVEADKFGNRDMMQTGFIGTIFGMNVHRVSTNAGMTTTTSYLIDRKWAYAIAEKRPITVENFDLPSFDMSAATVTQRLKVRHIRANAIVKITTT